MRYLVTGATGFIGSRLTKKLIDEGNEVVAFVRNEDKAKKLREYGADIAIGDITDKKSILRAMNDIDGVFHLAAIYQIGRVERELIEEVNIEGSKNVFEAMMEKDVKRGVYTSSLAVFSNTQGNVYDETYKYEGEHLSLYDETKWYVHYKIARPMIENGLNLITVMPGLVYGPGDTSQLGQMFKEFLEGKTLFLPSKSGFCFTYIDDAVNAHILAMKKGTIGEEYIISGAPTTLKNAVKVLRKKSNSEAKVHWLPSIVLKMLSMVAKVYERFIEVPLEYTSEGLRVMAGATYLGTNKKAKEEVGFQPRTLEQGFEDMLQTPRS